MAMSKKEAPVKQGSKCPVRGVSGEAMKKEGRNLARVHYQGNKKS